MSSGKGENSINQRAGTPHKVRTRKGSKNFLRGYPKGNHAPSPIAKLIAKAVGIKSGFSRCMRRPLGPKMTANDTRPMKINPIPAMSLRRKRLLVSMIYSSLLI